MQKNFNLFPKNIAAIHTDKDRRVRDLRNCEVNLRDMGRRTTELKKIVSLLINSRSAEYSQTRKNTSIEAKPFDIICKEKSCNKGNSITKPLYGNIFYFIYVVHVL